MAAKSQEADETRMSPWPASLKQAPDEAGGAAAG